MKLNYDALRVGHIVRLLRGLRLNRMRRSRVVDNHSMKVNYDVLGDIMRFLRRQDLVNVMCTSRASYEVGLPVLLGQPIHLKTEESIQRFLEFILKDAPRYGPMLRDLTLDEMYMHCIADQVDPQLAIVIEHTPYLRRFVFAGSCYAATTPLLVKMLLTRPSHELRQVALPSFEEYGQHSSEIPLYMGYLSSVSWPSLVHLRLGTYLTPYNNSAGWPDSLRQFSPTLETLELSVASFPPTLETPFNRLRTLRVYSILYLDEEGYFPTTRLVRLFPQLKNLYVTQIMAEIPSLTLEACRECNIQDAVTLIRDGVYWPHLVHVSTAYDALCSMGLKCQVQQLDLSESYYDLMWKSESIVEAIRDLQPCALSFGLPLTHAACHKLSTLLVDSPQLSHLEYELTLDHDDPKSSLKSLSWFLNKFLAIHHSSSCVLLRIFFSIRLRRMTTQVKQELQAYVAEHFNMMQYATQFAIACPSLRRIFIHWSDHIVPPVLLDVAHSSDGEKEFRIIRNDAYHKYGISKDFKFFQNEDLSTNFLSSYPYESGFVFPL
ncbi:hypothetical protein K474DRAFT_1332893 [Panus rudis PR-1116 ss-1]|nr:hypothetical protein K474DRAFT_1332893 [Panus rudis PR-1116 ss-1]